MHPLEVGTNKTVLHVEENVFHFKSMQHVEWDNIMICVMILHIICHPVAIKKIYYHVKNAQKYHMSALELVGGYKTSRLNVKMLIIFYWMLIIECLDGVLLSLVSVWSIKNVISLLLISHKGIKM